MPRKARIDAPGAVHHIIIRGIEKRNIFRSDADRKQFVDRLGALVAEMRTQCLAWALIPNHAHFLLRTGESSIASLMQRLLTGYAVYFNLRHHRHGPLFQNRYKSILCQEAPYLKELVRYLHLNPLRAGRVESLEALDHHPWCGHGAIMGTRICEWQDVDGVLKHFGKRAGTARRAYRRFLEKGVSTGRRPDLVGGGLIRSAGGWDAVKKARKEGGRLKGDERVLGDTDFVLKMLAHADERLSEAARLEASGLDFHSVVDRVAVLLELDAEAVLCRDKTPQSVLARRLLCHFAHHTLGLSTVDIARRLNIHQSVVSRAARQGRRIASEQGFTLFNSKT